MTRINGEDGTITLHNAPVFIEDKCCSAAGHMLPPIGKWETETPRSDEYHLTSRIMNEVKAPQDSQGAKTKACELRSQIKACFSDIPGQPGKYIDSEHIVEKLHVVREIFLKPEAGGLWTAEVEKEFQNTIPHIRSCLQLPSHIKTFLRDRDGRIILKRGTNSMEAGWRYDVYLHLFALSQNIILFISYTYCRVLLRFFPEMISMLHGDPLLKCLIMDTNILRMIQYDKRWPEIEIPYWLAPDILLIASMAEKTFTDSPIPKICLVNRKWTDIKFGWDASTTFCTSQEKNKEYPSKLAETIPEEAELFLIEEIAEAASISKTHTYVLHHIEEELINELDEYKEDVEPGSSTATLDTQTTPLHIYVKVGGRYKNVVFNRRTATAENSTFIHDSQITSPQIPVRKNKPGGTTLPSGLRVQKQAHHSNHGKAASHKRKSQTDVLAIRQIKNSYPTSAQYHYMHGNLQMFAKILYPLERQLLKYLILQMTESEKLSEVTLQKQHKKQLHKVCD